MLHVQFRFIWPSGFREEDILKIDQLETSLLANRDEMSNRYREPYIDASYQVSTPLTKRF
jgi:hypothetical protein